MAFLSGAQARIAVVEDDAEIRSLVVGYLAKEGFEALPCADGAALDALRAETAPDLIVLDLMMPGEDGLSICRRVAPETPVLVLSAKGEDFDRIIGLEVGADDYLPKPFNPRELVARIRAVLRRRAAPSPTPAPSPAEIPCSGPAVENPPASAPEPAAQTAPPAVAPFAEPAEARDVLVFDGWRLDVDGRGLADPSGAPVPLSSGEMALLIAFARRPNRVLSRDQLLDLTRGREIDAFDRAVDVQVSRLRRKLSAAGGDALIRTVRGDGYLFAAAVARAGTAATGGRGAVTRPGA